MALRNEPVQSRADDLVDRLIRAVDDVVSEVGPDAASTGAFAKAASVSVGSVYRYFPNKLALYEEYMERYKQALHDRTMEFLESPQPIDDSDALTRLMVTRSAEMLLIHPAFPKLRLWRRPDNGELIAKVVREQESGLLNFLLANDPNFPDTGEDERARITEMLIETTMTLLGNAPKDAAKRAPYVEDVIIMISAFLNAKAN